MVQTPHLDALAAQGTRFTNAYTPSPMCVPARAALACGDYVHRTGYWDSAKPYDGQRQSWMYDLRDAGMHVASIGKLHFRSGDDDNGFSEEILPMHVVGGVGWTIGLVRDGTATFDSAGELAEDVGTGASSYTDYDLAVTSAAEDWLAAPERKAQPWAAFLSLVSPHYPLIVPERFAALYDPAEMPLPVGHGARPDHDELQNMAGFFDYARHFDEDRLRQAKAAYFGLVSFMDDCVGRVLAALEASGQADDTLVIYASDHGEMLGDHGLWTKQVMYEASVGVPLILAGPGVRPGVCGTGASLLDIAATAHEVAGLPVRGPGASLRDVATAADDPARVVFSEYHDGGSTTGTFMVRQYGWKYVHYEGYAPQLFDLATDPAELHDLASSKPDQVTEMHALLRTICDPAEVTARAFADQAARIEALGGREACLTAHAFNHTPAPATRT